MALLRAQLKSRGLPAAGNKQALVAALTTALAANTAAAAAAGGGSGGGSDSTDEKSAGEASGKAVTPAKGKAAKVKGVKAEPGADVKEQKTLATAAPTTPAHKPVRPQSLSCVNDKEASLAHFELWLSNQVVAVEQRSVLPETEQTLAVRLINTL